MLATGCRDSFRGGVRVVSKQPRKQRLALYAAPPHLRHVQMAATLSPELRAKHGRRSLPVRKGDKVRITRGDFRKLEGDVLGVDTKRRVLTIAGATTRKADGTEVPRKIHPSNVMLLKLVPDKEREKVFERKVREKSS